MGINLHGAVACVTGGGRGIGLATAKGLAAEGAIVWIGDIDKAVADAAAAAIGGKVRSAHLDVSDHNSFQAFISAARKDGPVALLVNNAGIMRTGTFCEQDSAGQAREIAINFTGVVTGTRLVLPDMLERNIGHVVNISSMAGMMSVPGAAVYTGTKFAVTGFSRAVRAEISGSKVTMSCIFPAAVRTDLTDGLDIKGVPTVNPSDVAEAIIASCRTGQEEITLPRWVKPMGLVEAALPEKIAGFLKRIAGAQRRITTGNEKRRSYSARA
jgi:short-subunit dehydrogenase